MLQEAGEVIRVHVVFVVAVGEHEQVQVSASGHHLVEGAELLKVECSLIVVSVCLLQDQNQNQNHLQSLSKTCAASLNARPQNS